MRILLCLCSIWLSAMQVRAQQSLAFNIDSLLKVVKNPGEETGKIHALQQLSDHWLYIDSAKSMQYAQTALQKSVLTKDSLLIGIGYYYTAGVLMEHYNLEEAKVTFHKAISFLEPNPAFSSQQYLARVWHNLGAIEQREDNDEGYLDLLIEKTCPILERIGDSVLLASNYYDIGCVFINIAQYDKGLAYFEKAVHILQHHPTYADAVESHLGIVKALLFQEDYAPAKRKRMTEHLAKAHQLLEGHPDAYPWEDYYIMAGMYQQYVAKDTQKALKSYDAGLAFVRKRQDEYISMELLNRKYYLFYEQGQYRQAKQMLDTLNKIAARYPLSRNQLINFRNMVNVEEALGHQQKAFTLLKSYVDLADSVNKKQSDIKLNLIEQKYRHEKKEREISELKAENKLKSTALRYNKIILSFAGVALICLLILLALGFLLYRNKQQLAAQEKQLHNEQLKSLKQQQQVHFFNAMIQGQEQERKRLASDLHDGLGGLLSNVKLLLSKNPCKNDSHAHEQHDIILAKLDTAVDELRRIARNMMPETLLRFGLVTALRDFCEDLEKCGVCISFQTYGLSEAMDKNQQIMVYRIMQELINNAIRHAQASNILVQCIQDGHTVYMTVEDDGNGFDMQDLDSKIGIGLVNVKNRVSYLNGQLDIQSEPGVGTTINIEFDVNTESEYIFADY